MNESAAGWIKTGVAIIVATVSVIAWTDSRYALVEKVEASEAAKATAHQRIQAKADRDYFEVRLRLAERELVELETIAEEKELSPSQARKRIELEKDLAFFREEIRAAEKRLASPE